MCIRYYADADQLVKWSNEVNAWVPLDEWLARLDTFPGYIGALVTERSRHQKTLEFGTWGMQPPWATAEKYGKNFGRKNAYNAKAETLTQRPTFKPALRGRRCVVPMTGFFDQLDQHWMFFRPAMTEVLVAAGLYEEPNQVSDMLSYTVVTTDPNDIVAPVQDRMPAFLTEEDMEKWLNPETPVEEALALLTTCPNEWLLMEDFGEIERRKKSVEAPPEPEQGTLF